MVLDPKDVGIPRALNEPVRVLNVGIMLILLKHRLQNGPYRPSGHLTGRTGKVAFKVAGEDYFGHGSKAYIPKYLGPPASWGTVQVIMP